MLEGRACSAQEEILKTALIDDVTGQDGAYMARLLPDKSYIGHAAALCHHLARHVL